MIVTWFLLVAKSGKYGECWNCTMVDPRDSRVT